MTGQNTKSHEFTVSREQHDQISRLGSFQSVMRPLLELDEIFFTIQPPDDREKSWQLFGIVIAQCQGEIKAEKGNV
jgi:hypothetical protein